jgi:hypothetical protein
MYSTFLHLFDLSQGISDVENIITHGEVKYAKKYPIRNETGALRNLSVTRKKILKRIFKIFREN